MSRNAPVLNFEIRNVDGVLVVNSRVVAKHFGKEHRNILRDVDTLISRRSDSSDIDIPWFFEVRTAHPTVTDRFDRSFDMTRDGFSLLAMGFTGAKAFDFKIAYIEEFKRMEAALRAAPVAPVAPAAPTIDFNDPVLLRGLLFDYTGRVLELQEANNYLAASNAEMAPKAAALARIASKDGDSSLQQASKELFGKANAIFAVLEDIRWIYKRAMGSTWCPHQDKVDAGYLAVREVECADGKSRPQTMITPKGRVMLAERLVKENVAMLEIEFPKARPQVIATQRERNSKLH